jgi:hypothetical protein
VEASTQLPLTHAFLAMMLAIRRPGVTVTVQNLECDGMIAESAAAWSSSTGRRSKKMSNGTYDSAHR